MEICISGRVPYEYALNNGYAGASMDIFSEAMRRMGEQNSTVSQMPWQRELREVAGGRCDVLLSGVWDKERAKTLRYPAEPIGSIAWQFFSNRPDATLKGVWGGVQGFVYPDTMIMQASGLKRDIDALNEQMLIEKLFKRRVDCIAVEVGSAQALATELHVTLYPVGKRIFVPLYSIFKPEMPETFISRFNQVMRSIRDEGIMDDVYLKYGLVTRPRFVAREGVFAEGNYPAIVPQ